MMSSYTDEDPLCYLIIIWNFLELTNNLKAEDIGPDPDRFWQPQFMNLLGSGPISHSIWTNQIKYLYGRTMFLDKIKDAVLLRSLKIGVQCSTSPWNTRTKLLSHLEASGQIWWVFYIVCHTFVWIDDREGLMQPGTLWAGTEHWETARNASFISPKAKGGS